MCVAQPPGSVLTRCDEHLLAPSVSVQLGDPVWLAGVLILRMILFFICILCFFIYYYFFLGLLH